MTIDEHKNYVNQLLTFVSAEHQANASDILNTLREDYETTISENETLTNKNNELTSNNETLREVNAKLFLKVGETKNADTSKNKESEQTNKEPEQTDLKFENLFNEKGELI